ncbi:hypothetical protein FOA52_015771 [Chlamydomonas sp. UWO 241]|nr:hypothetical protein FOA52_015771 [Chlamydomonas sp. UWO 241]
MGDLIRSQHEMEVAGSSKNVYGTVAVANAVAKAQFDMFRLNQLAKAKKRALGACGDNVDHGVFNYSDKQDEDENVIDQEFTEFMETTDADGAASWSWDFTWWERIRAHDWFANKIAHRGFVRVERCRVLAEGNQLWEP